MALASIRKIFTADMTVQEKQLFINELKPGQQVQDVFLVSRKTLAETKNGKPYLALGLMDKTGEIEARLWDNAVRFDAEAAVGNFVAISGSAKSYRDQVQLGLVSLKQVEGDFVRLEDFMPASKRRLADMEEELQGIIDGIQDVMLRTLLQRIFSGQTLELFVKAPAAKKMHHAYVGGLIEHTLSIVGMAVKTAGHYPMLDMDMLIAGALLHDVAKIEEFNFSSLPFEYTGKGRLVGHLVLGVEIVRTAARELEVVDSERIDQLVHLILSHHGQLEFGSPVVPMTPEALVLHHLDDVDAKMNYIERLSEKIDEPGWHWTEYQRPLERFLYLRSQGEGDNVEQRAGIMQKKHQAQSKSKTLSSGQAQKKQQSLF